VNEQPDTSPGPEGVGQVFDSAQVIDDLAAEIEQVQGLVRTVAWGVSRETDELKAALGELCARVDELEPPEAEATEEEEPQAWVDYATAQDWADLQSQRLNLVDDETEVKARFAKVMSGLCAAKVKGSINGKNWSVGARGGKDGTKTNNAAVSAIFYQMLRDRGVEERELEEILATNTIGTHQEAFIQGYFNSINKDRKALRAAMKATPLAEDLTA